MPTKTTKASATKASATTTKDTVNSMLVAGRNEIRKHVLTCEDNREFKPLDLSLIRPLVVDSDISKFDMLVETGNNGVVEIDLNRDFDSAVEFLRGWLQANGKNRTPKATHYSYLADKFREGFAPDATNWVLDRNGMVRNGGHSSHATVLAFYPPFVEYGISGSPIKVTDENDNEVNLLANSDEGNAYLVEDYYADDEVFTPNYYYVGKDKATGELIVFESQPLVWKTENENKRVGQFDDDGRYVEGSDTPSVREGQDLRISLRINADPTSCLKMDDVRLEASFDDYLEMVAPIRAHMDSLPQKVKEVCGTIFRNYYLRVNHKTDSYGSLGKGGRLNKSDVQQWYIAGITQLLDSVELLLNSTKTDIAPFVHFSTSKTTKGSISLVHALVAMMVVDTAGRKRIAKLLLSDYKNFADAPESIRKLRDFIIKPKSSPTAPANADQIVQALVFVAKGSHDPVEDMTKTYNSATIEGKEDTAESISPWQCEPNRFDGWDRSNTDVLDDGSEEFTDVCIEAAKRIASILGNEGNVSNAKMKATRKGAGPRAKK